MSRAPVRPIAAAVLASAVAVLPVPLVGGLAVLIEDDLGMGDVELGAAIAAFYLAAAIVAMPAGRASERLGPRVVAWLGLACIVAALLGIGLVAASWQGLAAFLALAGAGHALTLLAVGVLVSRAVTRQRQGLAFGVSQAAAPAAALLAGLSVPTLALTNGWQIVFITCASLAFVAAALMPAPPREVTGRTEAQGGIAPMRALILLAIAMAFASAAGNSTVVFIVVSTIDAGFTTAQAGIVLAFVSAIGLAVRIGAGWLGDRIGGDAIGLLACVLAVGAVGFAGLATVTQALPILVFTVLAFGGGWGWPGLMLLVATRSSPAAPGVAMGIVTFGGLTGAVVGPIAFGAIAEASSYAVSWLLLALLASASIVIILISGRWIRRSRAVQSSELVTSS